MEPQTDSSGTKRSDYNPQFVGTGKSGIFRLGKTFTSPGLHLSPVPGFRTYGGVDFLQAGSQLENDVVAYKLLLKISAI